MNAPIDEHRREVNHANRESHDPSPEQDSRAPFLRYKKLDTVLTHRTPSERGYHA